ncbi:O-antigen polymerase [Lactiplantibacillus plantarum]|uniref:O-antigen polymerase n=1 Tax=Lactiplantibacillus plantarum TaxID=1590 RepID=UPI001F395FE5|nr:O-antigen polymerase [Lactiplantibacillus plantarum]MCF1426228.1 oligosaccharide repeat unit polymerase [Lactiplantibacillus plantarum]
MYVATLLLAIFFLLLAVMEAIYKNSFFIPDLLFYLPLFLSYVVYFILFREMYPVSNTSLLAFDIGLVAFFFGTTIFKFLEKFRIFVSQKTKIRISNHKAVSVFFFIGFISFLYSLWFYQSQGLSLANLLTASQNFRENITDGSVQLPFLVTYGKYFLLFSTCSIWYEYNFSITKINFWLVYGSLLITVINSFLALSRTDILVTLLPLIYIWIISREKQSFIKVLKTYSGPVILLIGIFIIMGNIRTGGTSTGGLFSSNSYLMQYIGYQLVSFDKWIVNLPSQSNGFLSFEPIDKLLTALHISSNTLTFAPHGQFTTYSYLQKPYLDHGQIGVFLYTALAGLFSNICYFKANNGKNSTWTLFYSVYTYAIIMAFFSWQFTIVTYIYLLLYIITCYKLFPYQEK